MPELFKLGNRDNSGARRLKLLFQLGAGLQHAYDMPEMLRGRPPAEEHNIELGACIQQRIDNVQYSSAIQAGGVRLHYFIIE